MSYFHGTNIVLAIGGVLLPPVVTGALQTPSRCEPDPNRVFCTSDLSLAQHFANSAARWKGGTPVVYEVEPSGNLNSITADIVKADKAEIIGIVG